jgi:late competence protein required for DNA uptake (superfamily II DNA/RNA helicase)
VHGIDVSASHLLLRFRQKSQLLFALFLFSVGSGLEEAVALGSRSEGDDIVYQTTSADGKKKRNCYKKSKMEICDRRKLYVTTLQNVASSLAKHGNKPVLSCRSLSSVMIRAKKLCLSHVKPVLVSVISLTIPSS